MGAQFSKILQFGLLAVTLGGPAKSQELNLSSSDPRFVRRLYIDLTGRLPTLEEREAFNKVDFDYFETLTTLLAAPEAATSLSRLAFAIWQVRENQLPDLERFIAAGNTTLGTALTASTRTAIVEELRLGLRNAMANQQPISELFSGNSAFATSEALAFWGLSGGTAYGPLSDPHRQYEYIDDRIPLGVATSSAALATIDSHDDASARIKAKNFLEKFACQKFSSAEAHRFADIDTSQLDASLIATANTDAKCAGCHSSYDRLRPFLTGLTRTSSFEAWKTMIPPTTTSGTYAGHEVDSIEALSERVAHDPRFKSCLMDQLLAALFQRQFDDSTDYQLKLTMLGLLELSEENFQKALRLIFLGSNYAQPALSSEPVSLRLRISGLRFLSRRQWDGIAKDLAGSEHGIELSDKLNPEIGDDIDRSRHIPGSQYFSAVNDFVRMLARKTLELEFNASSITANRKLFTSHASGPITELSVDDMKKSIAHLLHYLVGDPYNGTSPEVTELLAVFETVKALESSTFKAWEAVLVSIMLSPRFLSY